MEPDKAIIPYKTIVLGLVLITGILLQQLGWFHWQWLFQTAEKHAEAWWFPPSIIAAQIVLYTFALPGSALIWVAGLLYDPLPATMISVAGGVVGAATAYGFCRGLSADLTSRMEASRFFRFMRKHTDLATLSAVRSLPNFPHSVINYGASILGVPLPRFLISSLIGFSAKGYLYTSMISRAAEADRFSDMIGLNMVGPLFIFAALFIIGKIIQRHGRANDPG
jgi:uncharacterized membrane protein YdjX (TVP38/TMEM64 family)